MEKEYKLLELKCPKCQNVFEPMIQTISRMILLYGFACPVCNKDFWEHPHCPFLFHNAKLMGNKIIYEGKIVEFTQPQYRVNVA